MEIKELDVLHKHTQHCFPSMHDFSGTDYDFKQSEMCNTELYNTVFPSWVTE